MAKSQLLNIIEEQKIISKIYLVRGEKVMLDRDLAKLFGVETKVLKQAVRRNKKRFPKDFLFEMTAKEMSKWRAEAGLSREDLQGLRYAPFCFTEQGVTMLSCILNSDIAIESNIKIVRVFTKLREYALTHKEILIQLAKLEKEVKGNSKDIENIFTVLKEFIDKHSKPSATRPAIGFRTKAIRDNENFEAKVKK
jgi:ORF6N domain